MSELTQAQAQENELTRVWVEQSEQLGQLQHERLSVQDLLTQKQALVVQDIKALRSNLSALNQRKDHLNRMSELFTSLAESTRVFNEQSIHHETFTKERLALAQQIQITQEQHNSLEREIQLLETQLSLLENIQSFEDARQKLVDGKPCPLCGAEEHPFAKGNRPHSDETSMQLNTARINLKITAVTVSDLKVKQAEIQKDLEQTTILTSRLTDKIAITTEQINQGLLELVGVKRAHFSQEMLQELQQENHAHLRTVSDTIGEIEQLESEIATLRETCDKTKEAVAHAERDTQTAVHHKEMAIQTVDRLKNMVDGLLTESQHAARDLLHDISPYGVSQLTADVLEDLTHRRNQWLLRQKKKAELERDALSLERDTQYQHQQITVAECELEKQRGLFDTMERELNDLSHHRSTLYQNKNPDHEEARFIEVIDTAERALDAARERQIQAIQVQTRIKHKIEELDQSIELRFRQLNLAQKTFQARLDQHGFADEAAFLSSCLSEDERKKRMHLASELDTEQTKVEEKWREVTSLLTAEQQKKVTIQTIEALTLERPPLLQLHRDLQHEIGGLGQKLKDNDRLRKRLEDRVTVIESQKKECSRWNILHELIGSVDGKKYRNFAQGLTFEMMIGHANRQLLKMTDRYLLSRDEYQPLELNVVDNYQAGEVRSTKNLSGGESFLVSLCLALGLSQMSSQNVRVDSLFLDEGFGTLDDDALDTALETLAGLQHEGKLIGMISHVPALKERISTQIRVTPKTGGRSVISGFGCRLVENPDP